jgi:hypothetical protein
MASETTTVDVWMCVDSAGDYGIGKDEASARENYESEIQSLSDADGFRLVKVSVTVPLPEPIELEVEAPAEDDQTGASAESSTP